MNTKFQSDIRRSFQKRFQVQPPSVHLYIHCAKNRFDS